MGDSRKAGAQTQQQASPAAHERRTALLLAEEAAGRRGSAGRSGRLTALLLPAVTGLAIVGVIEAVHRTGLVHPLIWPSAPAVMAAIVQQAASLELWRELLTTLQEAGLGLLAGGISGFVAGSAVALWRFAYRALYPFFVVLYSVPTIALAPVFIAVFGFGMAPKVITAAVICFFPVLINTVVGIRSVGEDEILLMRSLRASKFSTFRRLLLPNAVEVIVGGLKTTITLAFVGAIVAELITTNAGVGRLVAVYSFGLQLDLVFASILWLSLSAYAVVALVDALASRLIFWRGDDVEQAL